MKNQICVFAALAFVLLCSGCLSDDALAGETNVATVTSTTIAASVTGPATAVTVPDIKVEVYHFHGNSQCVSCTTVGTYAENTLSRYYMRELASGKLVFAHVNYDLPENLELAKKYEVTGSSLWIGTYINGKFNKEEDIKVWYRIDNETEYSNYLKGVLDKRLMGDLL